MRRRESTWRRIALLASAAVASTVLGLHASDVVMIARAVTALDLDPNQHVVPSATILGQLWTPQNLTIGKLDIDLSIGHHAQDCTSSKTSCATATKGFGTDDAWPMEITGPDFKRKTSWRTKQNGYAFMVNGTYFYKNCPSTVSYETADCESTAGPVIAGGRLIIPPEHHIAPDVQPLDVLMFNHDGSVVLVTGTTFATYSITSLKNVVTAIGGNILVSNGTYSSACDTVCHAATTPEPRTAIAFDGLASSNHIYFLVIQPGRQAPLAGATAAQTANYLIQAGLKNAFMLDGGGSSTYVYQNDGGVWTSTPGDTIQLSGVPDPSPVFRPVTTVIGIRNR